MNSPSSWWGLQSAFMSLPHSSDLIIPQHATVISLGSTQSWIIFLSTCKQVHNLGSSTTVKSKGLTCNYQDDMLKMMQPIRAVWWLDSEQQRWADLGKMTVWHPQQYDNNVTTYEPLSWRWCWWQQFPCLHIKVLDILIMKVIRWQWYIQQKTWWWYDK